MVTALRRYWVALVVAGTAGALVGGTFLIASVEPIAVQFDLIVALVMDRHVVIRSAWAQVPREPGAPVTVYLKVIQIYDISDQLVGVSTPVARSAALSTPGAAAIVLTGKEDIELKPGGRHIVLSKLTRKLGDGDTFPLTLHFDAGDVTTQVRVRAQE